MIWIVKKPGKIAEQICMKPNFKQVAKKQAGMDLARHKPATRFYKTKIWMLCVLKLQKLKIPLQPHPCLQRQSKQKAWT